MSDDKKLADAWNGLHEAVAAVDKQEAEVAQLDALLYGHYSGNGQWLNSLDVDLAWARISFLEAAR